MDKRDLRNAICNFTGETIWGFHANLIPAATVLTVLLTRYGAGTRTVGLIAAIENSMMLVPQILGVYLFHARRGRKVRLILWHLLAMLPVILAMSLLTYAADHVPAPLFRGLMLGGFAYFLFAIGIVMAAWMDFIAHVFPIGIRGKVVGASFAGFSLAGTLGALTAGTVIRRLPAPDSFALLYLLAWLTGTVGMAAWVFVQEREAPAEHPPRPGWHELLARFRHSLGEPNFRHFLIARILATCGFCIMPFITAYYLSPAGSATVTDIGSESCSAPPPRPRRCSFCWSYRGAQGACWRTPGPAYASPAVSFRTTTWCWKAVRMTTASRTFPLPTC
jgi:MFS family permease